MTEKLLIRNSTAEFLVFQLENKEQGIEVMYADETIWCTQEAIAALFDKGRSTIAEHLQNAFSTGELKKDSVCRKFRRTATDGKGYNTQYYNLDAVISVGYRANSVRATQFRQWATVVLRQFAIRGYVLDKKRMENGTFLGEDYFEHLLAEIREIRLSLFQHVQLAGFGIHLDVFLTTLLATEHIAGAAVGQDRVAERYEDGFRVVDRTFLDNMNGFFK